MHYVNIWKIDNRVKISGEQEYLMMVKHPPPKWHRYIKYTNPESL